MGQYFIFGALCPSKSGLMNKHIVKHTLCPSHIVKHTVLVRTNEQTYRETYRDLCLAGLMPHMGCPVPVQVRTNEQTYRETYRET